MFPVLNDISSRRAGRVTRLAPGPEEVLGEHAVPRVPWGWREDGGWARGLTAEGQQASVGDGRLAQVQHLEHREVFRQEPQAGVSELRDRRPQSGAPPGTWGWGSGPGRGRDLAQA